MVVCLPSGFTIEKLHMSKASTKPVVPFSLPYPWMSCRVRYSTTYFTPSQSGSSSYRLKDTCRGRDPFSGMDRPMPQHSRLPRSSRTQVLVHHAKIQPWRPKCGKLGWEESGRAHARLATWRTVCCFSSCSKRLANVLPFNSYRSYGRLRARRCSTPESSTDRNKKKFPTDLNPGPIPTRPLDFMGGLY